MAKEFKEYDRKYSKYKNKFLEYEMKNLDVIEHAASEITECFVKVSDSYSREEIRNAVYLVESAEEWQKFRVSLKGMSTQMKLARVMHRAHWVKNNIVSELERFYEEVRIDNYIGALRRGGQLDADYKIVK